MSPLPPALTERILAFRRARDWEPFHTPLDLAVAISAEAGELLECFQWSSADGGRERAVSRREAIEHEVADLLILLTYFCHDLGIDPAVVAERKLALNEQRYPVDRARGTAEKYDRL